MHLWPPVVEKAKNTRMVLFDCVNTLLIPDSQRLPRIFVDGHLVPSTAPLILPVLQPHLPKLDTATLHLMSRQAWTWASEQRGEESREVSATVRLHWMLERLGLPDADDSLVHNVLNAHFSGLRDCFQLPEAHRKVLNDLKPQFSLALFSNFDHAPSLKNMLDELCITGLFDHLFISDDLGYRKPGDKAFSMVMRAMGLSPEQVLFVGDDLEDDIMGGLNAGLEVIWFNPRHKSLPDKMRPPSYMIHSLEQLLLLKGQ